MDEYELLRPLPEFDRRLLEQCQRDEDAGPLVFEWYKHVAILASQFVGLAPESAGYIGHPSIWIGVLHGLLTRCGRLMLATMKVGQGKQHAETIAILGRCIAESAIIAEWLCVSRDPKIAFRQYFADGLKSDFEMEDMLLDLRRLRGGKSLRIESRMLKSLERKRRATGLTRDEIAATKKLPDLRTMMCKDIKYSTKDYIVIQRVGSRAIHGTWSDLMAHYVRMERDGTFVALDIDETVPHVNQLMPPLKYVPSALKAYFYFTIEDEASRLEVSKYFAKLRAGVVHCIKITSGRDFELDGQVE